MHHRLLLFLIFILPQMAFSQPESDYIKTESGLQLKIFNPGQGNFPAPGDMVTAHYTGKLLDGTIFDSSVQRGTPFDFEVGTGQVIKGWDEGFQLLKKGAKATFIIPADLAYGDRSMGSIPPNSVLIFDVELIDIKPGIKIEAFNVSGKEIKETASGVKYISVKKGTGPVVEADCNVEFHYTAFLEDMKIFDSTHKKGQTLKVLAGNRSLIPGLDEGLLLMKEGDHTRFIIPPQLGFGSAKNGAIPANATLIFDIEMVKVNPKITIKPYAIEGKRVYNHSSGLQYIIIEEGSGERVEPNQSVEMHYTGYLADGTIFDSSIKRNQPFSFKLGLNQVIKGWEIAVPLMKVGDKMRLILPPDLGYGDRAVGNIPPNSQLTFDVELLRILEK
jgi:peptidylprolyl isomerase